MAGAAGRSVLVVPTVSLLTIGVLVAFLAPESAVKKLGAGYWRLIPMEHCPPSGCPVSDGFEAAPKAPPPSRIRPRMLRDISAAQSAFRPRLLTSHCPPRPAHHESPARGQPVGSRETTMRQPRPLSKQT